MKVYPSCLVRLHAAGIHLCLVGSLFFAATAQASVALPIVNRIQWLENDGYCGETSLQECALLFGMYVSQAYVRNIFDPTQQIDLAEIENWQLVCERLKFKSEPYVRLEAPTPQFREFSGWLKSHLVAGHPVILATWISAANDDTLSNPPFSLPVDPDPLSQIDHFVTATGFVGQNDARYRPDEVLLITNHYFSTYTYAQRFDRLFDTRENRGAARDYAITLPQNYCFGLAITGVTDQNTGLRPVRIALDRIDEPNLITGAPPANLKLMITVSSLVRGREYVLLRYDDPGMIPMRDHAKRPSSSRVVFRANTPEKTFTDEVRSDGCVSFRCVPTGR